VLTKDKVTQCRVDRMWRHLACQVFIMTKFA